MIARIDEARSAGDTVGGVFEVVATGVPIGLGSHVHWDRRLDAALAGAVMSIPIVKGVEFGLGFEQTRRFGSAVMDVIEGRARGGWLRRTNNAGGLEGGISNGQPIVIRGAVKPISTLPRPLPSADLITGRPVEKAHYERSDICVVPAAGVVAEAMVCLTLADFVLDKFGGDSLAEMLDNAARVRGAARRGRPTPVGRRPAGPAARPGRRRPSRPRASSRAWTSSSSACPAAARAPSGAASRSATGDIRRSRRARGAPGRQHRAGDLRRGGRGRLPPPRTRGRPLARTGRPGPGAAPRHRDRRRRGHRPAQPLAAVPRPLPGLARRPAGDPGQPPGPKRQRPAAGRRQRSAGTLRKLAAERRRFYAPALQISGTANVDAIVKALESRMADGPPPA